MAITTVLSNLRIPQRLRSLGNSFAQEELEQLKQEARIEYRALDLELVEAPTPPYKLVKFYIIVSPWCDRNAEIYQLERKLARIDYGQYTEARNALVALAAQEERCSSGVNRTSYGQLPSVETTFLGNRCGLWTNTVAHWEANRDEHETQPAIIGKPHPTVMEVIDAHASTFLSQGLARWKPLLQALIDS
jgi:hypothetical protein